MRSVFDTTMQKLVNIMNDEEKKINMCGFMPLSSSIDVYYRNEMSSSMFNDFELQRQGKLMRQGKYVCKMHIVDSWRKKFQVKNHLVQESNCELVYIGLTSTKDVLVNG